MKKIKTRDIILIAVILILAAVLLIVGLQSRKSSPDTSAETQDAAAESEAADTDSEAAEKAKEYLEKYAADSYLIVTTSSGVHTPIPLNQEGSFKITFANGEENVVHIGINSFYMESSTCDNQNCVGEGEVTLENRDSRALYNMVLCLPHNVTLELVDADEALTRLTEMYESAATQESVSASAADAG